MRYGSDQFYVRPPEEMYKLFPEHARRRQAQPGDRRRRATSSSTSRNGTSPSSLPPGGQDARGATCATSARRGCATATATTRPRRCRDRLEHELGIICRMGFASYFLIVGDFVRFAVEQGHPVQRPRLGVRGAGQLRPEAQPRRSAGIRPAVRALPRSQPLRGARHRHRLLPGSPRGSDRLRPAEVRRGERGPDRHLRHDGGPGGHQGRGPGPRRAAASASIQLTEHDPADAGHHARRGARAERRT